MRISWILNRPTAAVGVAADVPREFTVPPNIDEAQALWLIAGEADGPVACDVHTTQDGLQRGDPPLRRPFGAGGAATA